MEKLVSIVIPVYNVKPYIKECLDSILNQSFKNPEILNVDDGSTDKSGWLSIHAPPIAYRYGEVRYRHMYQERNTPL